MVVSVGVWIHWFVSVVPVVMEEIFPFIKLDLCVVVFCFLVQRKGLSNKQRGCPLNAVVFSEPIKCMGVALVELFDCLTAFCCISFWFCFLRTERIDGCKC